MLDLGDRVLAKLVQPTAFALGTVLPARSAVALGTPNPDHVFADGLAVPGDSGSGVMTADWLALGRQLRSDRLQVGDDVVERFWLRNRGPLPKLWVVVRDGATLPGHEPGRVVSLGSAGA